MTTIPSAMPRTGMSFALPSALLRPTPRPHNASARHDGASATDCLRPVRLSDKVRARTDGDTTYGFFDFSLIVSPSTMNRP